MTFFPQIFGGETEPFITLLARSPYADHRNGLFKSKMVSLEAGVVSGEVRVMRC